MQTRVKMTSPFDSFDLIGWPCLGVRSEPDRSKDLGLRPCNQITSPIGLRSLGEE